MRAAAAKFALGLLLTIDAHRAAGAAAPGKVRKRGQGSAGAAVMVDESAEGARADVLRADQAQPVEVLLVAQANAFTFRLHPFPLP